MSNTHKIIGVAVSVSIVVVATLSMLGWKQIAHFFQMKLDSSPSQKVTITDASIFGAKVVLKSYPFQQEVNQKTMALRERNTITVTITSNPADAKNKFKREDEISSGFSYGGSDLEPNLFDIRLYISPLITEKQDREAELSRVYLTALLTAASYSKNPANPDYTGISELVLIIMNEAKQTRQYPIRIIE